MADQYLVPNGPGVNVANMVGVPFTVKDVGSITRTLSDGTKESDTARTGRSFLLACYLKLRNNPSKISTPRASRASSAMPSAAHPVKIASIATPSDRPYLSSRKSAS